MVHHKIILPLFPLLMALRLTASDLVCDGVLGNSGGQGASLVHFGQPSVRSLGVVVDRWGCLWDRAGRGTLIRCTADGRMLAHYRISPEEDHYRDRMAIAGDTVVMLLRGKLYTLALEAEPGSEAQPLKQSADALAPTAWQGRVLVGDAKELAWLDPATGTRSPAGPGFKDVMDLEVGPDGTLYAISEWKVRVVRDGREVMAEKSTPTPGEKPQLIAGAWYSHAWHSTIKRHDLTFSPAPGVVLGGNSGSFIGHVDESPDVGNGRGLARLEDGLWAVSGIEGGICLLGWDDARRQFSVLRRISALPAVNSLALDGQGRITIGFGYWRWTDGPDAPLREGVGISGCQLFQFAPLGGGRFVAPGLQYGSQPRLVAGQPTGWRCVASQDQDIQVPKDTTGAAAVPIKDGFNLIAVTRAGKPGGFILSKDGGFRGKLATVALTTLDPAPKDWTSLAVDPQGHLLAAADGAVIVFEGQGEAWRELRRWNSWGEGTEERFGKAIWLQADGPRLWISDRDRHRVLCFDLETGKPLATYGVADQPGNDLAHLNSPQQIAPNGDRCVVHDAGNQRLLKLNFKKQ